MSVDPSRRNVAVPFTPVSAAPFVEAADPGNGWRVINVPPGQAEADTTTRVLKVSLDVTEPAAAARAQELARIAWGRGDEPIPTGLWAGFVFGAEEARLCRALADVGAQFDSGRCDGTGYVESVVAQVELASVAAAVAGAVSLVGSGEDEQEIIRTLGRLVRDPARKVARCAEVALKAMAVARAALDRFTEEQRRNPAVSIAVASDVHRTVEAAAEEDRKREEEERAKDRERVEKAKREAREEAEREGSEDGDEGEGDDGHDDEADPEERDGKADDDADGAEGDEPDHEPEEQEGEGEESGDGPPSESPEGDDGEDDDDDDGEDDASEGDASEGMSSDDDAEGDDDATPGTDAAPAPVKPREESPEEKAAREAREAEHQRKIREAEAEAARAEQKRIDVERANDDAKQRRLESEKARKATDVIQRVRAATTAKEEHAAAVSERDAAEGISESRNEAKASRDEFHAAFGEAAAEAAKMIEVGADSMARTYRDRLGYRMTPGEAKWAPCSTINVPMPVKVKRIESPRKRWSDTGAYLRAPHRLYTDGYAFQHNAGGRDGGSVLIDVSGSMSLTVEDVARLVRAAPAVNVAVYAGDNNLRDGYLRVVASRGRMVEDQHLTFPFSANLCDGPALREWLAKQPMPRIWVSDGMVTGSGEAIAMNLMADAVRVCRAKSIVRVGNVDEAMRLFRKINPRAAALADRYEKEKADGLRA